MGTVFALVLAWCSQHLIVLLGSSLLLYTLWTSMAVTWMWKLRQVPGSRGLPILGHLPQCLQYDWTWFVDMMYKQTPGKRPFQAWVASMHHVVIKDIEVARRLLLRYPDRYDVSSLAMRNGHDRQIWDNGVLFARGRKWRLARKAFESALVHPKGLAAQAPYVSQVLSRGIDRLGPLADSGQPVDMLAAMYDCTMDAIGWTAFGIDLQATARKPDAPPVPYVPNWWRKYAVGSPEFAYLMLRSAIDVLKAQDLSNSGMWGPLLLLLPGHDGLLRLLAQVFPGAALRKQNKDFEGLCESIKVLIDTWRNQHQQQQQSLGNGTNATGEQVDSNMGAAVVSDQGILARMLMGKDMAANEDFEDWEVVSQAIFAIIGGYETTGVTLAVSLWYLANNPDMQAKAQQEVDDVLKGKDAESEDLERLSYIAAVMAETLRIRPAVGGFGREVADEKVDVGGGVSVPKGTTLYAPALSYHLDANIWPRADEFLPERHIQPGNEQLAPSNPHAYMPFGHGQRMCPGYKYAQMEGRMALARLMQRYTFEPVPGAPEPRWKTSLTFAPSSILLRITRRSS